MHNRGLERVERTIKMRKTSSAEKLQNKKGFVQNRRATVVGVENKYGLIVSGREHEIRH